MLFRSDMSIKRLPVENTSTYVKRRLKREIDFFFVATFHIIAANKT